MVSPGILGCDLLEADVAWTAYRLHEHDHAAAPDRHPQLRCILNPRSNMKTSGPHLSDCLQTSMSQDAMLWPSMRTLLHG